MKTIKEQLQEAVPTHMRAIAGTDISEGQRDAHRVGLRTARNVLGEIETREKAGKTPVTLDQAALTGLVQKEASKRRETAATYREAGQPDRADAEIAEAEYLENYLPKPLTREEVEALVEETIAGLTADGTALTVRDMGRVMKPVQALVAGRFDGKTISEIVKKRLA
ncbi:GatB/YqeY domain-containing protein [Tersicoccus sp. MR15.9]|uniref:GatB/YqeY domain-containing protein n=1 Tax=Tersicoccus mangrovi TaxID=3121635 RepID=UPI002FE57E4A